MWKFAARLAALLLPCLAGAGLKAQVHSTEQIEVELVAETTTVVPGETLWLGIRLDPIENWHTYWKFGGDSGEATSAGDWRLPAGVSQDSVGEIVWPIPEWTPFLDSGLVTFTYGHEVFLPLPVAIPADFSGDVFAAETTIDWQVCEVICIPGSARFGVSLPVADAPAIDERWREGFAAARANTPAPLGEHDLVARFNRHDGKVNVMVQAGDARFAEVDEAWFFPTRARVMQYAPYRDVMLEDSRIQISTEQHARHPADMTELDGLLAWVDEEGELHGYDLRPTLASVAWDHSIEVELIAENDSIAPGETTWLGLRLDPAEHWHTYWKMGGDSGEPTSLGEWSAPPGTEIGPLQFPAPSWLPFYDTDLVNFGYEGEVLHPVAVTIPADYAGDTVEISTLAYWNVCDLICIPGEQRLAISLPVDEAPAPNAANAEWFASARDSLPLADHDLGAPLLAVAGERVSLGFESPTVDFAAYSDAWFFPEQRRVIKPGPLRDVSVQGNLLQITHQQPRRMLEDLGAVYGTLVLEDANGGRTAYEFADSARMASSTSLPVMAASVSGGGDGGISLASLPLYMLFALLGGMILNLMPCVFPVLSLKALSFVAASGDTARRQRNEGLAYTGGILVSFVLLASLLIALRAAGEQVGWAFQFQQPLFLAFIVYLFFTLGLSLSGVFEIGTGFMGVGNSLTTEKGYRGSFFTGVLATIVATPCTAPFMGPALGFALTQPWIAAMLVFLFLGFGMALPILVLSWIPALTRFLPRPGAWMNTFKQFMAFPLYASAAFFLWVLGNQVGVMGMSLVLGVCILLALSAWLYQRRHVVGPVMRGANYAVGVATLFLAGYLMQTPFLQTLSRADTELAGQASAGFEPFSSARLTELRSAGTPVFVNMTADWCITCLVNEQSTLGTERVQQSMESNNIVYMKGDWTNEDPEITAVLEEFRRPSVPLYVLYPGDLAGDPVILPQILTPSILDDAFSAI